MTEQAYLKCRWCDYRTPVFYKLQNGKTRSGWRSLSLHVQDRHSYVDEQLQRIYGERWAEEILGNR